MPKTYSKRSTKRTYTRKAAASVRKPYGGGRYGNDAFVKVESIQPLAVLANTTNEIFSTMRVNDGAVGDGNVYLG